MNVALKVVCPVCKAKARQACVRVMGTGKGSAMSAPHDERKRLALRRMQEKAPACMQCGKTSTIVAKAGKKLGVCFGCERVVKLDEVPPNTLLAPGTRTKHGVVGVVRWDGHERYYLLSQNGVSKLLPASIVEADHAKGVPKVG